MLAQREGWGGVGGGYVRKEMAGFFKIIKNKTNLSWMGEHDYTYSKYTCSTFLIIYP